MSSKQGFLLSIFIPTFNRSAYLEQTITHFVREIEEFNLYDSVEILVGDNASSDSTMEILKRLKKVSENEGVAFRFYRNDSNVGITNNLIKGTGEVKGKFVWIFGDDDVYQKGILRWFIVSAMQNFKFITIKNISFSDEKIVAELCSEKKPNDFQVDLIHELVERVDLLDRNFGFISSNIVQVNLLRESLDNLIAWGLDNNNNYFIKAANYYAVKKVSSIAYLNSLIGVGQRITQGSHFTQNIEVYKKTFVDDLIEVVEFLEKSNFSQSLVEQLKKRYFSNNYLLMVILKVRFPEQRLIRVIQKRLKIGSLTMQIFDLLPVSIIKCSYLIYKKIRGTDIPKILESQIDR